MKLLYYFPQIVAGAFLIIFESCQVNVKNKQAEWIREKDSLTGYEVWQITSHDSASVACYFEAQAFTKDDKYVVFSSRRTGEWQLYRCDLRTGEIRQLTNAANLRSYFTMHPDGERVCYIERRILCAMDIKESRVDTLMDFSATELQRPFFSNYFTNDGKYTLVTSRSDSGLSIYRIDLFIKKIDYVLTWKGESFSHPLINPVYPDLITFVPFPDTQNDMTLPMDQRARTWIANMKTGDVKQFLTCPYGFRATHETWSPDGERFYFFKKTEPGWIPVTICSINKDGGDWQEYYTNDTIRLGHGRASDDGRWFISDGQDPDYNPLILIDLTSGAAEFLCWSNASIEGGHEAFAHVHPSFSSSGNYVTYTSDKTGIPQVYVVPVWKIKDKGKKIKG